MTNYPNRLDDSFSLPHVTTSASGAPFIPNNVTSVKTSNYTASAGDFVRCDPSLGGFIITLPAASGNSDHVIFVKNITASPNVVTVAAVGLETIDGLPTYTLTIPYEGVELISDGINWLVK